MATPDLSTLKPRDDPSRPSSSDSREEHARHDSVQNTSSPLSESASDITTLIDLEVSKGVSSKTFPNIASTTAPHNCSSLLYNKQDRISSTHRRYPSRALSPEPVLTTDHINGIFSPNPASKKSQLTTSTPYPISSLKRPTPSIPRTPGTPARGPAGCTYTPTSTRPAGFTSFKDDLDTPFVQERWSGYVWRLASRKKESVKAKPEGKGKGVEMGKGMQGKLTIKVVRFDDGAEDEIADGFSR